MAVAAPSAAAGSAGVKVSMPEGRPIIATADGRASLAIGGLVQFFIGGYFQNPNPNTQIPRLNNGVNLRRSRLFFVGQFDEFTVNITPDFGGSPDGSPTLYEANVNYTGIKAAKRHSRIFPSVRLVGGRDVLGRFAVLLSAEHHQH